ncbi:unnamed protein product [Microthlaspi erraticum]|uniref:Arabidopsis retrotransposon Orf1 C-terminal domain-containing protein n=1 Tax=Microthlaspi erraticum TaxID=1685480 RepID=A0A6D2KLI5_9BRAS|nr:unnamed protein product [Microthlaspi erraticum]
MEFTPKQLAKQARSKTKAPTPKPPKGSTKIEDEAKPRRRHCAKGHSWRDCLSSCESPTRYSLQGEKTWRIKDASCLYLLLSAKPYSQAKDLKQALHGRQPMRRRKRCENTIRAKPLAADAQKFWPSNFQPADRYGRAGKEWLVLGRIVSIARQKLRATRTNREGIGRDRPNFRIGTDRPCRSIRETTIGLGRNLSPNKFGRPNRSTATKSIGHRPSKFSRPRYPMAKTKGNESMKKKKNPFMEPPKKQIKLGSSSSNARAAIPTSPHSIDASQEHVESPTRGEDDWALVSFVGEQIQDPRKCKKAMEKVNIEPCVKMDTQTLDLLKIRDDVTWYIRKLGLSKLFKLECSEYSLLTKEFLSTVALAFPNHNGDQPAGDGLLLFKIGDANGRISISALCQLFGLPNETAHDFKENSKRKQAAFADWTHFANEPFLPSRSKVSRITHPAIRYVHRLISTTFQCKQEANKVTTDEFYILTTPFIKHEYKANLGLLLAKTFINVRKLAKDLEGNKKLCVRFGRLITAIVHMWGLTFPTMSHYPSQPLWISSAYPLPKPLD